MATLTLQFRAESLQQNTVVQIYLPDGVKEDIPVLYLLHGMYGDECSWINGSAIGRYARERKVAVVMPRAENSFYTNMKYGYKYYDYVAKELPEYLAWVLPALTKKREKTYIAGLSMGGYGAMKIALRNPDRFTAAATLSGCVNIAETVKSRGWSDIAICNWGEDYVNAVKDTPDDLLYLLRTFPKDKQMPRLYVTCGTEDGLYKENQVFKAALEELGADFRYEEGPGVHNWAFWDEWIAPAMDYMMEK